MWFSFIVGLALISWVTYHYSHCLGDKELLHSVITVILPCLEDAAHRDGQWWHNEVMAAKLGQHLVLTTLSRSLLLPLSVGGCFDKGYKLWTESQPNCRSVSGAITIIVQEVGITNSLARYRRICDYLQLTGYKLPPMPDNHLKGYDPIPVLHSPIFGKGTPCIP